MSKIFSVPRGTTDILPAEAPTWRLMEAIAHKILAIYGYQEIRTPFFEETALFARSLGETSDVVQKQMLNLEKEGLSLRPEGTASIVRSYIENNIDKQQPLAKLYYVGAMFRGERPQKGRLRQFHQIGVEAIGPNSSTPFLDAEVIALSVHLLEAFGLSGFKLKINSLGSSEDKKAFSGFLREKLQKHLSALCEDCQQRFERNVFRILDCKNPACRDIVKKLDIGDSHLGSSSREYFTKVKDTLKTLGVFYEVSPYLVRGLDYYTHTVFEISHEGLGSQDALGAGGRYSNLVKDLNGPPVDAIGFALGLERIILAKGQTAEVNFVDVFLVALGEAASQKLFLLLNDIRHAGISAEMSYQSNSIKNQMRLADKSKARFVLILGENELKENVVMLKNMQSGEQEKVSYDTIKEVLKKRL